jgi:hypothetical protein
MEQSIREIISMGQKREKDFLHGNNLKESFLDI